MILSIDSETTGLDFYHGCKPFIVTTCADNGTQNWWEWPVDPRTRQPSIPEEDKQELQQLIDNADRLVFHNAKFDIHALKTILPNWQIPWRKVEDTLIIAHLLASNRPKDLTSLTLLAAEVNRKFNKPYTEMLRYETEMDNEIKSACQYVRRKGNNLKGKFRLAKKDEYNDMPSAKGKAWKFDMWVPKTVATICNFPQEHHWHNVTLNYAKKDSEVTLPLYYHFYDLVQKRGLDKIYRERLKLVKIAYEIEDRGVTTDLQRSRRMYKVCQEEIAECEAICRNIAADYGVDLKLPKGGTSKVLADFVLDKQYLGLEPRYNEKSKSDKPTLDKNALIHYSTTLDVHSKELAFIKALKKHREVNTAKRYLESYAKFWLPLYEDENSSIRVLHPGMNITGSATLRWTSSNPNSQNIGKGDSAEGYSLRYCFGPAPGREWYSIDAKNIELRIPAYLSGEQTLIELFEKEDEPPFYGSNHILIFSVIWEDLWNDAVKKVGIDKAADYCKKIYKSTYYQWTKNGNFAVQYQAGDATADKAYHQAGARQKILKRFEKQAKLNYDTVRLAEKHGYIETIPDKEVDPDRGYPLLCTYSNRERVKPTIPLSYKIQGSAMWYESRAMVKSSEQLDEWREESRFDGFITMQVHDELVFDFPKTDVSPIDEMEQEKKTGVQITKSNGQSNLWRIREICRLKESCGDAIGVPVPCGIEYHPNNWGEGVKIQ